MLRVSPPPVIILAIDHPGLLRMQFQVTVSKPPFQRCSQPLRLSQGLAVAEGVIRKTLEGDIRKVPLHPPVEDIMQKEITQNRANNPALRTSFVPRHQGPVFQLHRGLDPPLHIQQYPLAISVPT